MFLLLVQLLHHLLQLLCQLNLLILVFVLDFSVLALKIVVCDCEAIKLLQDLFSCGAALFYSYIMVNDHGLFLKVKYIALHSDVLTFKAMDLFIFQLAFLLQRLHHQVFVPDMTRLKLGEYLLRHLSVYLQCRGEAVVQPEWTIWVCHVPEFVDRELHRRQSFRKYHLLSVRFKIFDHGPSLCAKVNELLQ